MSMFENELAGLCQEIRRQGVSAVDVERVREAIESAIINAGRVLGGDESAINVWRRSVRSAKYLALTMEINRLRADRPTLSDDDLREEAARRGMTVVDAQEWARVRAIADGPTPATDEAACPTCGCPTECPEGLAEERDRLRAGIEALAAAAKGADVVWAAMEAAGIRATRGGAA